MNIGIPRALIYYNYFAFWQAFFKALGIDVILSDKTTKQTISDGSSLVVTETCLPVKVYIGHVLNLLNKGVDTIFVPSIQSIAHKIYNCSKIRALPDLVRNVVKKEFKMIEATFDLSEKNQGMSEFLASIAAQFGIKDKRLVSNAERYANKAQANFRTMTQSGISFDKALAASKNDKIIVPETKKNYEITVALISHGYNIYDDRVSMKIFDKLEHLGVKTLTFEQLTLEQLYNGVSQMDASMYWANELEMTGAAGYYLKSANIDGIITVTSFGCGPDSLMVNRINRHAQKMGMPHLCLTLDEHTGEAGFITRLEAFCDMLHRKKRVNLVVKNNETKYISDEKVRKQPNFDNITVLKN